MHHFFQALTFQSIRACTAQQRRHRRTASARLWILQMEQHWKALHGMTWEIRLVSRSSQAAGFELWK
jgi:hypothetical protein